MDALSKSPARDFGLLLVVFVLACVLGLETIGGGRRTSLETESQTGDDLEAGLPRPEPFQEPAARLVPLHTRLGEPKPGEWLDRHPEQGQTFASYRGSCPNRPDATHTTLYIQPLGAFAPVQSRLLEATVDLLGRFYGQPVRTRASISLDSVPAEARRIHPRWGDAQILGPFVLDLLRSERPDDAVAMLALTTVDLWPGEARNFVFGQASLQERVGVWSLYRQGDPELDFVTCLRRTLKTATHETGHMLGIRHCTFFECCMNGSNHRAEADSRPLWFCPEDEQKVWWSCRLDPALRYRRLVEFARAHGLDPEAAFWQASEASLKRRVTGRVTRAR
jgi:archaemetzincin